MQTCANWDGHARSFVANDSSQWLFSASVSAGSSTAVYHWWGTHSRSNLI